MAMLLARAASVPIHLATAALLDGALQFRPARKRGRER